MINLLTLLATAAVIQDGPPATSDPAIESWTCTVQEQLDQHVSGMLQTLVYPNGERRELSFYINWAVKPGHIAEQQLSWVGIPPDAATLWKPDKIAFSVSTQRTDKRGGITFDSAGGARISETARGKVQSLRPNFHSTWVSVEDAFLVYKLWSGWPWEATLSDSKGTKLGSQAIQLPRPEVAQAMFTRLRTELDRSAADRSTKCAPNRFDAYERMLESI